MTACPTCGAPRRPTFGKRIFWMTLEPALAPTMNVLGRNMQAWAKAKLRNDLDARIFREALAFGGHAKLKANGPRGIRVTRYTPKEMDDLSVDGCGGKYPVDRLVKSGILAGDSPKYLVREAQWVKTKPGTTRVMIEVFELEVT